MTSQNPSNQTTPVTSVTSAASVATEKSAAPRSSRSRTTRTPRIQGKQTFMRAIRAEWVKIRSLRSTWITSGIAVAITVLIGAGMTAGFAQQAEYASTAKNMVTAGSALGMIVVAVLGALIITGEYSSGQIRSSLAAVPHRGRLLAAKAIVASLLAFVLGAGSVLASWAISLPFMDGHAGSLTDPKYVGFIWGTGLAYVGITLMAMGLGYLMRSTAGSITVVVTLLFVIDIPLQLMSMKWDWAMKIQGLGTQVVSSAVTDPFALATTWADEGTLRYLEHWQAALVFGAWAIIPIVLGWVVFSRRDA